MSPPTGFWSDIGGTGSPGLGLGTAGPGGYREPFITETEYYNNVGVNIKRQSYSFSYGYNPTNDFILMRHVLNATGDVDVDIDGFNEETGAAVRNFFTVMHYDFDVTTSYDPNSNSITENNGGDDAVPSGFFTEDLSPSGLTHSDRFDVAAGRRGHHGERSLHLVQDQGQLYASTYGSSVPSCA